MIEYLSNIDGVLKISENGYYDTPTSFLILIAALTIVAFICAAIVTFCKGNKDDCKIYCVVLVMILISFSLLVQEKTDAYRIDFSEDCDITKIHKRYDILKYDENDNYMIITWRD